MIVFLCLVMSILVFDFLTFCAIISVFCLAETCGVTRQHAYFSHSVHASSHSVDKGKTQAISHEVLLQVLCFYFEIEST